MKLLLAPDAPDRKRKPGDAPLHRVPVFDHKGNMRGHVARSATAVGAARVLGRTGAKLKAKDGRPAWIGDKPPPKPKPKFGQPNPASAATSGMKDQTVQISLRADKGQVTKKPDKPEAHARPRR